MIDALPALSDFRSTTQRTSPQGVDRRNKIVMGAKLIEAGGLNDSREWVVDEDTLQQVVDLAESSGKRGVKARFTHPNMSNDGLGSYLGRWTNFRIEGDAVYADLHIADSAFESPKGDLGTYTLDLAEEDPEAFGVSLATCLDECMQDADPFAPLRFSKIRAADFVDEPAATRGGLFAVSKEDPRDLPACVTQLLDTHFGKDVDPDVITGRFHELLSRYLGKEVIPVDSRLDAKPENTRDELSRYVEAFGDVDGAKWYLEEKSFGECYQSRINDLQVEKDVEVSELKDRIAAQEQQITDLQQQIESVDLGEEEPLSSGDAVTEEKPRSKRFSDLINIRA